MSEQNKKPNRRYIANVVTEQGQYGAFSKVLVNNVNPNNKDGTPNKYYRGNLLWVDAVTGKKFLVKQLKIYSANNKQSLYFDLDDEYNVQELS